MLQTTSLQQVKIWSYARADLVLRWALKVNVILHIITSLSAFADIFQRADGVQPESWARSIAAKTFLFLCFRSRLPQDTFVSLFRCKQRPLSNRLSQTEQSQCSQLLFTTLTVSSSWFNPVVTWLPAVTWARCLTCSKNSSMKWSLSTCTTSSSSSLSFACRQETWCHRCGDDASVMKTDAEAHRRTHRGKPLRKSKQEVSKQPQQGITTPTTEKVIFSLFKYDIIVK